MIKRGYADTPEGQIHYHVAGSGKPLLMMHQTGSSRNLLKLMAHLTDDYRVYAIDNLGEGNSDALPPNAEIHDMARSYTHFMDALGMEKAHIFGMHTGNKVGTEIGACWPERVDGLILCGQTHSIQSTHKNQVSVMGARDRPMLRKFDSAPSDARLLKEWATEFNYLSTMWWGTDDYAEESVSSEVFQRRKDRVLDLLQSRGTKEKYRAIFAYDLGGRMRDIKVKNTLMIEIRVPGEAHLEPQGPRLIEIIPNSRLATVQHTGDGRSIEGSADKIAAVILEFLKGLDARGAAH